MFPTYRRLLIDSFSLIAFDGNCRLQKPTGVSLTGTRTMRQTGTAAKNEAKRSRDDGTRLPRTMALDPAPAFSGLCLPASGGEPTVDSLTGAASVQPGGGDG